jgi:hypothetical protein
MIDDGGDDDDDDDDDDAAADAVRHADRQLTGVLCCVGVSGGHQELDRDKSGMLTREDFEIDALRVRPSARYKTVTSPWPTGLTRPLAVPLAVLVSCACIDSVCRGRRRRCGRARGSCSRSRHSRPSPRQHKEAAR